MGIKAKVIAIGGGGFTHGTDSLLDRFVLDQSRTSHPRIGYIGTASQDSPEKIERFYRRFADTDGVTSHLPGNTTIDRAKVWIRAQDILYVGGGDTGFLLDRWRQWGLVEVIRKAATEDVVLAGVSAGAICWFDFALSNAGGRGLAPLSGLGLIKGSCCPHYSSEPERRPAFEDHIADGRLPDGIAIDDGVAVLIEPNCRPVAISARCGASAYLIQRSAEGTRSTSIPVM